MTIPNAHLYYKDNHLNKSRKCPNCGSSQFVETTSREYCPSCKLECNYWGKGPNDVYQAMMDHRYEVEERAEQAELDEDIW